MPAGTIVPLPLGSLMKAGYGIPCAVAPTLPKCNNPLPDNATLIGTTGVPGLLYPSEVALLKTRGAEYNAQIKTLAEGAGYKVFDSAALLADIAAHGRDFAGITLTSAYLSGGVFSYDGVHPSATGYAIVADALVQFVNANYGTNLPRVDMAAYLFNGNSSAGGFPTSAYGPPSQRADHRVRRGVLHAGGPRATSGRRWAFRPRAGASSSETATASSRSRRLLASRASGSSTKPLHQNGFQAGPPSGGPSCFGGPCRFTLHAFGAAGDRIVRRKLC